ncbi:hypothetical protein Tco_1282202 [Tanacetum coccineum]
MLATMNQIVNLLSGFQKQFPPTNNQPRTSSNSGTHAMVHDGKFITETVQRRAPGNVGNTGNRGTQSYGQMTDNKGKKMLIMEAKEKGAVLDAEAEAFLTDVECTSPYDEQLAITTTNVFEVSHKDAYDSDVDEGPNTVAAFMANLETHDLHKTALGSSNLWNLKQAKLSQPTLYDSHALLNPTHTSVKVHDSEDALVQAKVSRAKMSERLGIIKPINYAELNALYSHFVPHKELSRK